MIHDLFVCPFPDSRSPQADSKNLPPLIPTKSLPKRSASVDSLPPDQRTPTSNEPNSHLQLSELTSWQCQQCHKTFTQRVALQMHVCQSQPTKPFQCGQCGSTFNNSSELRTHVVSHTTERPFKCGFCSRTFVGATTLNNHVRTHMGQKPFSCEKCGKAFSQAMHLARHACELSSGSSGIESVIPHSLTSWIWIKVALSFVNGVDKVTKFPLAYGTKDVKLWLSYCEASLAPLRFLLRK